MEIGVRAVEDWVELSTLGMDVSACGGVAYSGIRAEEVGMHGAEFSFTIRLRIVLLERSITDPHNETASVNYSDWARVEQTEPLSFRLKEGLLNPGGWISERGIELQTGKEPQILNFD